MSWSLTRLEPLKQEELVQPRGVLLDLHASPPFLPGGFVLALFLPARFVQQALLLRSAPNILLLLALLGRKLLLQHLKILPRTRNLNLLRRQRVRYSGQQV
jgi:hypothetical protein